jgi:hypothetical protein
VIHVSARVDEASPAGPYEEIWDESVRVLQREFGGLWNDPDIARTFNRRGILALYRMLPGKLKMARITDRPIIKSLLKQNRLFIAPIRRMPALFSIGGTGCRFYPIGPPFDESGARVLTHFIVVLSIPICPLTQYVAKPGGSRNSWRIVGRIPMTAWYDMWSIWGFVLLITIVVALATFIGYSMSR